MVSRFTSILAFDDLVIASNHFGLYFVSNDLYQFLSPTYQWLTRP